MKDSIKLILSIIILFGLIIFAYQKNMLNAQIDPQNVYFQTASGPKNLKTFNGKIVLLYFGFLSCPDVCPTTMSFISKAFKQLSPEDQKKVEFIFVDLDPKRDTMEKLRGYVEYFNPNFQIFLAEEKSTRPFARFFGVDYREVPLKSNMGYTVDHSTDIVVLGKNGKIIGNIHHGTDSEVGTSIIKDFINSQP